MQHLLFKQAKNRDRTLEKSGIGGDHIPNPKKEESFKTQLAKKPGNCRMGENKGFST